MAGDVTVGELLLSITSKHLYAWIPLVTLVGEASVGGSLLTD